VFTKLLFVIGLHKLEAMRKSKCCMSLWPANNSSHSGIASMCWWTHSKRLTDYSQKSCSNWALSIQWECEQHYCFLRIFKSVCSFGSMKSTWLSQTVWKEVCSDLFSHYKADSEYFFVTDHQWEWNMDPSLWTTDKKDNQWNGIIQILLGRRSLRLPL
jgi:hypothetical protein